MTVTKPRRTTVGETVTFDAADSTDPDGDVLQYQWDFGDGATTTTTAEVVDHVYTEVASYTAIVTVVDPGGLNDSAKKKFTIYPVDTETEAATAVKIATRGRSSAPPTAAATTTAMPGTTVMGESSDQASPLIGWGLTIGAMGLIIAVKRQVIIDWWHRHGQPHWRKFFGDHEST